TPPERRSGRSARRGPAARRRPTAGCDPTAGGGPTVRSATGPRRSRPLPWGGDGPRGRGAVRRTARGAPRAASGGPCRGAVGAWWGGVPSGAVPGVRLERGEQRRGGVDKVSGAQHQQQVAGTGRGRDQVEDLRVGVEGDHGLARVAGDGPGGGGGVGVL